MRRLIDFLIAAVCAAALVGALLLALFAGGA